MTAVASMGLAAVAGAGAILLLAAAVRPAPSERRPGPRLGINRPATAGVTVATGSALRRLAGRPHDPVAAARLGRLALVVAAIAVVDPRLAVIVAIGSAIRPVLDRRRARRRHEAAVVRELPEVIDLVGMALSAGGSVLLAVTAVSARPVGPVSAALGDVATLVRRGHRIADALEDLPDRLGPAVRPLVRALVASERYGVELGPALERIAGDAREDRRRRAQTAARRVPVRMLLPLVLGVLPAFVLLTLVPTLVATFDSLDLGGRP